VIAYPYQLDGVLTRVLEAGSGQRSVVLVHGVGARADRWRQALEALATDGFHAYALDLPGHGFAQKGPAITYTVPAYARLVSRFIETIGWTDVSLVGTSMGGHVVGTVTCEYPDRVKRLVLVGSMGLVPVGADRRGVIADAIQTADPDSIQRKLTTLVYDPALVTPDWVLEEHRINTSPGAQASFQELARYFRFSIDEDAVGDRLAQLAGSVPIQLIWGRDDRYVPLEIGTQAHTLLTGSSLAILDRCGHAPYLERPELFNPILIDFLKGEPLKHHEGADSVAVASA
jgi:pimeloyl-ACP methyl ester carboxylesterase